MCAALLLPNCRDAFLRLSQLPSLRDRRFYSAILLAETQECVSTSFRRTHVNIQRILASLQVFVELTKYVPRERKNTRFLLQTIRREARNTVSWPKLLGGKVSRHDSCPTRSRGKELSHDSCPTRSRGKENHAILVPCGAAGKNCRTILVPRGTAERNCRTILVSPERRQAGDNEQSCPTGIFGTRLGAR